MAAGAVITTTNRLAEMFGEKKGMSFMFDILEGWRPDLPPHFELEWPRLAGLIRDCWQHDFTLRPS